MADVPLPVTDEFRGALVFLRHDVRTFVAMSNADPERWFGNSRALQYQAVMAHLRDILMTIRRLSDKGWRKKDMPLEPDLYSMYRLLEDRGRKAEADELFDSPEVKHLRFLADKSIAHAKPLDLAKPSQVYPDLSGGELQPVMLSTVVAHMSRLHLQYLEPDLHSLDLFTPQNDPWSMAVQHTGLPVLDFPALHIFLDPIHLHPDLRRQLVTHSDAPAARNCT